MSYIITFDDGSSAYLEHYGVAGMKWGVRHDSDRALNKAMGKLSRLDSKAVKAKEKRDRYIQRKTARFNRTERAGKLLAKAAIYKDKSAKFQKKSDKAMERGRMVKWMKTQKKRAKYGLKAKKLEEKATGVNARSNRMLYKQEKKQYKASKWAKKVDRVFGDAKLSGTKEQQALGKKYALRVLS